MRIDQNRDCKAVPHGPQRRWGRLEPARDFSPAIALTGHQKRRGAFGSCAKPLMLLLLPALLAAAEAPKVTFLRDVAPILNKVGCTSGTCHGAAKGKNGFKLSLRGYDPQFDYEALLYDLSG